MKSILIVCLFFVLLFPSKHECQTTEPSTFSQTESLTSSTEIITSVDPDPIKDEDLCPPVKPILCNGKCVQNISKCSAPCNFDTPFRCGNGTCVSSFTDCFDPSETCESPKFVCWNGVCADSPSLCDPLPACSKQRPKRCWNSCIKRNEVCSSSPPPCPTKSCPDGSCIDNNAECPSYNGCPLDTPFQCSDGRCVLDDSDCNCGNGKFKCFDRRCVNSEAECMTPPFQRKPFKVSFEIDPTQEQSIDAVDSIVESSPNILCTLTVPPSAFQAATNTVVVNLKPVADSKLKEMTGDDLSDIISSVVNFTLDSALSTTFLTKVRISCRVVLPINRGPSDVCLAFINETTQQWQCVDTQISEEDGMISGWTDHFTAYGVLFTGEEPTDDTQSTTQDRDKMPLGIIIGVVIGVAAIAITIGAVMLVRDVKGKAQRRRTRQASFAAIAATPVASRTSSVVQV